MQEKVAVVGIGGVFPDAPDLNAFWNNIINKAVTIRRSRAFDTEVFYRPKVHGRATVEDKSYTELVSMLDDVVFDPARFRIPPRVASHMDIDQKLSLLAAEQAMADGALRAVDRDRVAVVIGASGLGELHHKFQRRFDFDRFSHHLALHDGFSTALPGEKGAAVIRELRTKLLADTFPVTEDSAPGILPNIIAARLCSVFDFHGPAYTVDAACASGLAAVVGGVQHLRDGTADAVVCGAIDVSHSEAGQIYFSGIGALSAEGSFPFDERASGFIIGDGGGLVILKRLRDAVRNGDTIYAVITGYAQSSDGKGKAIAAPNKIWQAKTIQRAWEMAGSPIDTVELVEAHGTATRVGDVSEVEALRNAFSALGGTRKRFCGLGSVKSNIGHLKSAAGIAGFLKAILALKHKVLPPSANFERENPALRLADSPFYVLTESREWVGHDAHPRRAGISAFGFGGANYHIAIEEYREHDQDATRTEPARTGHERSVTSVAAIPVTEDTSASAHTPVFFSGQTFEDVLVDAGRLLAEAKGVPGTGHDWRKRLFLQSSAQKPKSPVRLAFTVDSVERLREQVTAVERAAASPDRTQQLGMRGIYLSEKDPMSAEQLAFLFPGQGSQYADMGLAFCRQQPAARALLARADLEWQRLTDCAISKLLDSSEDGRVKTESRLRDTRHTHPALAATSLAVFAVLDQMKVKPALMIGHSVGEIVALIASGRLTFRDGMLLLAARSRAFDQVPQEQRGAMVALNLDDNDTASMFARESLHLTIANRNSPTQTIVSGEASAVERLQELCAEAGIKATKLNVSHAFHSPAMAPAGEAFAKTLQAIEFRRSAVRVMANESNDYYPTSSDKVRRQLETQITGPVNFRRSIERAYQDGARVFVEVGPGSVLSSLAKATLQGKDVTILASDSKGGDQSAAFNKMLCGLFATGLDVELCPPFEAEPSRAASLAGTKPVPAPSPLQPMAIKSEKVVYSGVAVGLPGSFKDCFRDDNFEQLFEGRNLLERLTDGERQRLVELRITKLVKSEQGASFVMLDSMNQVIQLAGKLGRLDLQRDYLLEEKDVLTMSNAVALAVAAGFEALRDAHIPLIHEYTRTTGGHTLPDRWALPQEMQPETGVIFANGFPLCDPVIKEVSRHLGHKLGRKLRSDLFEFYDGLIAKIRHDESRRLLADWFALNHSRLTDCPGEEEVTTFNHQFMTQIACQANNRLARLIHARGANFQINAACSSAATAITLAEDMIKSGRLRRVIVIGADDPTSPQSLPYLGAGFLATGACSTEADPYEAAVPFDRRRNGMVMGAGAVGIVVEAASECARRSIVPVCELIGSHTFNTTGHHSALDVPRYAEELERFVGQMESRHGLDRRELAGQLLYMSHEPYTPARGGSSESEAVSLRHVFGDRYRNIEVSNTKGMTGHTMGASIEDATAAKALQYSRIPPVVHHRVPDPTLEGLRLSTGGSHTRTYALRMAAGFGSQGNFLLLKKIAEQDQRISDADAHRKWLAQVSRTGTPELVLRGRTLVVKDDSSATVLTARPQLAPGSRIGADAPASPAPVPALPTQAASRLPEPPPISPVTSTAPFGMAPTSAQVLDIIAEITGYDAGTLLPDMELEADLGVDTVKQATILAKLGERFGVSADDGFRLADFLTIRSIIERFQSTPTVATTTVATTAIPPPPTPPSPQPAGPVGTLDLARDAVLRVIAEVTGYSADILTPDMELEADLGVDTVKQATIMAVLAEKAGFSPDDQFRMADVPSIGHIIAKFGGAGSPVMAQPAAKSVNSIALVDADRRSPDSPEVAPIAPVKQHPAKKSDYHPPTPIEALVEILTLRTDYPLEMLTPELSLHGDLALDPEVIEDIRCRIVERFGLPPDWVLDADASLANLGCSLATLATSTSDQTPVDLARQVLVLRPTPIAASETTLKQQSIWVIGDHGKIVSAVQRSLAPLVRSCTAFALPKSGTDDLIAAFERFVGSSKADIVVDTTACGGKADIHTMRPKDAEALIERAADARFRIYKLLSKQTDLPCRILAVTAMDGCFGLGTDNSARLNPVFGLYRGFYKTLRKEWRKTAVSILDVRTSEIADRIASELAGDGPGVEVCYLDGVRHRIVLDDVAFGEPSASVNLDLSDVVVATGGGSGITAQIVRELARRAPSRFLLTGRFELPEDVARLASLSEAEWNDEKDQIRKRLAGTGSGVPPIAVERELAALKRNAEIYRTVEALHAAGCEVRYRAVDARDRGRMSAVLNETRKAWGPITVLIHGAGIEISHSFFDKSADEFRQVHSVKTLGALHLGQLCHKDPLRAVVAFSSISARFGNAGQIDYTAANGFLDVWARDLGRCMGIRALSLAWSGWSEVGMAWRSSFVREMGEAAGVNLIDPQTGSQAAVREILAANGPTEVVLHRGLGFMNEPGLAEVDLARLPFIDWVEQTGGTVRTVHRRFSPKRDIILDQHRFGGAALMPGVGFIELLAEARSLFERPREGAFVFRGLEFSETLRFFREQGREVRVDVTPSPDFPGRYLMIAASPFRAVVATQTQLRRHCRAEVSIEPPDLEWVQRQNWEMKNVRQDSLKRVLASLQHLSYRVELGPLFNEMQRKGDDVEDVEVLWNNETICIPMPLPRLQIEHPGYARMQYLTNPAFLDSAHQTAAMFALLLTNEAFLPAGADEFVVLRAPNVPGTYRVIAKLKERSQDRTVYDIGMWNEQNELFAYIKRSAFKRVRQQL